MIYFIPFWARECTGQTGHDDMSNHIKSMIQTKFKYKVIIFDYMYELRYFLHNRDLLESDYISLFDKLQGFENQSQVALTLRDLNLPDNCNYVYTPFNILVYKEGLLKARITMGMGSQIKHVEYLSREIKNNILRVDVYDDRGFLSSQKYYESGNHKYTDYLDKTGKWIIREDVLTGNINVNLHNNHGLSKKNYKNIGSLQLELLNLFFTIDKTDSFLVAVSDENVEWLKNINYINQLTLSFFQERFDFRNSDLTYKLLKESNASIIDSPSLHKKLVQEFDEFSNKIHQISPYDSRFELSITQELKEEIIYVEARFLEDNQEQEDLIVGLLTYVSDVFDNFGKERTIKVILRTNYINHFKNTLDKVLYSLFPDEMYQISILPKKNIDGVTSDETDDVENTIDEDIENYNLDSKILKVLAIRESFYFKSIASDEQLFKIISRTRIIVDFSPSPDLFTQIAAISSGIPQVNKVVTDYCKHMETGYIVSHIEELTQVLSYYLDSMKNWSKTRSSTIKEIHNYSGNTLRKKLLRILGKEEGFYG